MARFCMNCGAKLEADDAFCPSCGHAVEKESQGTPSASQAPQAVATEPVSPVEPPATPQPARPPQGPSATPLSPSSAKGGPNWTAIVAIVAITVVAAFGIYLYHDNSASAPAQKVETVAKKSSSDNSPAERDKGAMATISEAYEREAITCLHQGEEDLAALASAINSGQYSKGELLQREKETAAAIESRKKKVDAMKQPLEKTVTLTHELFDIQAKRAECMAKGVRGDTNQFAVGGKYYDEFQTKFAAYHDYSKM